MSIELKCTADDCNWSEEVAASDIPLNCPRCYSGVVRKNPAKNPEYTRSDKV